MKTDENNPLDWLRAGEVRLRSVDHLMQIEGITESLVELLQEAVERYVKGYLISRGWNLRKTHDLGSLLVEAAKHDARFLNYEDFADSLTDQFWAQHYPGGDLTGFGENFQELRQQAGELIALIVQAMKTSHSG